MCDPSHPMYADVTAAYNANLALWNSDPDVIGADLGWLGMGICALCTTSQSWIDYWTGPDGILWGMDGVVSPDPAVGPPLAFAPYTGVVKSDDEPLSAVGDIDDDGMTNLEEYTGVRSVQGGRHDYFLVVADGKGIRYELPVAGIVGLALLACIGTIGGAMMARKKK